MFTAVWCCFKLFGLTLSPRLIAVQGSCLCLHEGFTSSERIEHWAWPRASLRPHRGGIALLKSFFRDYAPESLTVKMCQSCCSVQSSQNKPEANYWSLLTLWLKKAGSCHRGIWVQHSGSVARRILIIPAICNFCLICARVQPLTAVQASIDCYLRICICQKLTWPHSVCANADMLQTLVSSRSHKALIQLVILLSAFIRYSVFQSAVFTCCCYWLDETTSDNT